MNTQNHSTLQVFQSFSRKLKSLLLQSCPKKLLRFLCEWIVNLLKRNLQSLIRHHVANFQSEVGLLSLARTTWKQRRGVSASEKDLQLIQVFTPPVNCLDVEQFVLVPISVYTIKSLNTQSVAKQEFPLYQAK